MISDKWEGLENSARGWCLMEGLVDSAMNKEFRPENSATDKDTERAAGEQ